MLLYNIAREHSRKEVTEQVVSGSVLLTATATGQPRAMYKQGYTHTIMATKLCKIISHHCMFKTITDSKI